MQLFVGEGRDDEEFEGFTEQVDDEKDEFDIVWTGFASRRLHVKVYPDF